MRNYWFIALSILFISSCVSSKKITSRSKYTISGLKFVNEYVVPNGVEYQGTVVGGLSGIDYDRVRDEYYMICDDPSVKGPARFYTAKLLLNENGIDSVVFTGMTPILNPSGVPYPDITKDLLHSADLEAMRFDTVNQLFIRGSEGQRRVRDNVQDIQQPDIVIMDYNGRYLDSFPLPANMHLQAVEKGPRHNSVFEGLDFADDYKSLFVCVEEALYEDASKAGLGDSTSWVRFLKFDISSKKQVAQYAYEIDAIPYPANPPGAFKINGISDILYLGDEKFIVIERAYSTGRVPTDIKIYLADAAGAENIAEIPSLKIQPAKRPIQKKLLLNVNNSLKRDIFNVEGVTFGPALPNGRRSLVLVTDNNFNGKEKTQFLLFEVLP